MAMALYFDDPLDLCDFIRVKGNTRAPRKGFTLYRIAHPEMSGRVALLLEGLPKARKDPNIALQNVEVKKEKDIFSIKFPRKGARQCQILLTRRASSLLELVAPQPLPESPAPEGHIIFLLKKPELFPALVSDSMKLGNDRIQFANTGLFSQKRTLLRVEEPSHYILQRCLEDHPEDIELYYRAAEDLYVPWGYRHPLEDLWKFSEKSRNENWLFFTREAEHEQIKPVQWKDIYKVTEFDINIPIKEPWSQQGDDRNVRIKIPLRLNTHSRPEEPELWLLGDEDIPRLESLLGLVAEEELRNYLLGVLSSPEGSRSNPGKRYFFIREKRGDKKRKFLDFGGIPYVTYKGFYNLFVPAGRELLPPVRRDVYKRLFELTQGQLTLLLPSEEASKTGESEKNDELEYQIIRFPEKTFEPFSSLVDYIVESHRETLEKFLSNSVFDFKDYIKAPSRDGLGSGQKSSGPRIAPGEASRADLEAQNQSDEEPGEENSNNRQIEEEGDEGSDEKLMSELDKADLQLERRLVSEGQNIEIWKKLIESKENLGNFGDALLCTIEALWLTEDAEQEEILADRLLKQSRSAGAGERDITSLKKSKSSIQKHAAVFSHVFLGRKMGDADLDGWAQEITPLLHEIDKELRFKERWLLWRELLRVNGDVRQQAHLRENIRDSIINSGLSLEETPAFVRTRIFLDRGNHGVEESAAQAEYEKALDNLQIIREAMEKFTETNVGMIGRAILARAYAQSLGNIGLAKQELTDAAEIQEQRDEHHCWFALYAYHALKNSNSRETADYRETYESLLPKITPSARQSMQETDGSFETRENQNNPAEFLSEANVNRFYPKGGIYAKGPVYDLISNIRNMRKKKDGSDKLLVPLLKDILNVENKDIYSDEINIPQLVEVIAKEVGRTRMSRDGASLIPLFEKYPSRVTPLLNFKLGGFYKCLFFANLAGGMIGIHRESSAIRLIEEGLNTMASNKNIMDIIDNAAAIVNCIEQLPLQKRTPLIHKTMDIFIKMVHNNGNYLNSPNILVQALRLLDQIMEAAVSKEKMSLNLYKEYLEQDEFLILDRILREELISS